MPMNKQIKIVKLRQTGLKARIVVLPQDEIVFIAGYIFAPNKHAYYTQIIYYFCENFLQDIIPRVVGQDKTFRDKVFNELYAAISEYNPDVERCFRPVRKSEGMVMKVNVERQTQKKTGTARGKPKITKEKVRTLSKYLNSVLFGQEDVTQTIQDFFEMSFTGLGDPDRPRGSFIFVGDTGCGKTMAVKETAKHFFGKDWRTGLFVINGSEYAEEHEASKLLGSPQGYVGYDEGSPFFKHVQKNPECIVLVDEFEKAHPRLQDVFLQILDDGIAYDNKGKQVDFTRCFIVFTSNIGTKEVYHKNPVGFNDSKDTRSIKTSVESSLKNFCRIEFIKRLEGVVIFNSLTRAEHLKIADAEMKKISTKLKEKVISLKYDSDVLNYLVDTLEGEETARDINAGVKKSVTSPISKLLMSDKDYDVIEVERTGDGLEIRGVQVGKEKEGQSS
jgi:ATP-dependent Clp protease ATP-binding subunit ClpA